MTHKEKAEQYIRKMLPELMELSFGCEITDHLKRRVTVLSAKTMQRTSFALGDTLFSSIIGTDGEQVVNIVCDNHEIEILGHPPQLQHYLRVLKNVPEQIIYMYTDGLVYKRGKQRYEEDSFLFSFDLTTGQPATEADYQAFCEIVGIS